jgi:hypothetical protein
MWLGPGPAVESAQTLATVSARASPMPVPMPRNTTMKQTHARISSRVSQPQALHLIRR